MAGGADSGAESSLTVGVDLGLPEVELIANCDTLFVASSYAAVAADTSVANIDVSHRGGNPGFAKVVSPRRIRVPDYAGNAFLFLLLKWNFSIIRHLISSLWVFLFPLN